MKKSTLLYLFLILGFVLLPNQSLASSGACSYHGGVNCSVESSQGNAVCYDGFVSSTAYNSTVECQAPCQQPACSTDTTQCTTDLQYSLGGRGLEGSASEDNSIDQQCEVLVSPCVLATQEYKTCELTQQTELQIEQEMADQEESYSASQIQAGTLQPVQNAGISDSSCRTEFGGAAYADVTSNTCLCNTGYSMQSIGGSTQCVAIPIASAPTPTSTQPAKISVQQWIQQQTNPASSPTPTSLPSLPIIDFSKYKISIPLIAPKTTTASTSTSPASTTVVIEATATSSTIIPQQAPAKPTGFFTKNSSILLASLLRHRPSELEYLNENTNPT